MELFGLLKNGKPGGYGRGSNMRDTTTTIAAAVLLPDTDKVGGVDGEDEGPFFDLEFSLPVEEDDRRRQKQRFSYDAELAGNERELQLTASSEGSVRRDHILSLSPSNDLFFKGRIRPPLEPSSSPSMACSRSLSKSNAKPQAAAFIHKSDAKFRVFKLGLRKKSKQAFVDPNANTSPAPTEASPKQPQQNKFFIKFKVEEMPLMSLFARDSSSRSYGSSRSARLYADDVFPAPEDKKFSKDVLQKYLSKLKPLYVKVSKRYSEKLRFSGPLSSGGAGKVRPSADGGEVGGADKDSPPAPVGATAVSSIQAQSQLINGNIPAGLKVVCRRLRKSRSASAAVASLRSPASSSGRRDDSLWAQQDGIQNAIAHCKRSFNPGSESPLPRSRSDPGDGRSTEIVSNSI